MNWLKDFSLDYLRPQKPAIATAVYQHCSFAGTYHVGCEILECRAWCTDDAEDWERAFPQMMERLKKEKAHLNGYVIRYHDFILEENVTQWVRDLYISEIVYNDILESFRREIRKRTKNV